MKQTYNELLKMKAGELADIIVAQDAKIESFESALSFIKAQAVMDAVDYVKKSVGMNGGTYSAFTKYAKNLKGNK